MGLWDQSQRRRQIQVSYVNTGITAPLCLVLIRWRHVTTVLSEMSNQSIAQSSSSIVVVLCSRVEWSIVLRASLQCAAERRLGHHSTRHRTVLLNVTSRGPAVTEVKGRWPRRMRAVSWPGSIFTRRCGDTRQPGQHATEAGAKVVVHPAVDDWVAAAVSHRQPVTRDPDCLNVPVNHTSTATFPGVAGCRLEPQSRQVIKHYFTKLEWKAS